MEKRESNITINIGGANPKPIGCTTLVLESILFVFFIIIVLGALEFFR